MYPSQRVDGAISLPLPITIKFSASIHMNCCLFGWNDRQEQAEYWIRMLGVFARALPDAARRVSRRAAKMHNADLTTVSD